MFVLTLTLLMTATLTQDLAGVKAEPLLDKRAQKAIDLAGVRLTDARAAYEKGEYKGLAATVGEVTAAAELCLESLEAMGKHPSKNVKNYKLSEKRLRELLRRVSTFRNDVSFEDRPTLERAEKRITEIHEKLLEGALSKKP
jgi:exopolyphosphatase/pppGpp-phosphohydrolase